MYNDLEFIESLKDEELIRLVQNLNEAAFSELMSRYTPRIWHVIIANSRQIQDAEEILTDIWVAIWDNIGRLKKVDSFGPWLQKIAYTACNRYYASANRSRDEIPHTDAELVEQIDREAAPRFRENELRTEVREAVRHLPQRVRSVAVLYYLESWRMKEIAEELDLLIGTVKTKLREIRSLLRKEFDVEPNKGEIMSSEFVQTQNQNDMETYEKLITAATKGDCEATELLKDRLKPLIRNVLESFFRSYDDEIKTLESRTLGKVINSLDSFLLIRSFETWVRNVARHTAIQHNNQYFFNTVNPNSKRMNSKKVEQKESSGCGCGPPRELVEAFEKATIIPKELLAVKVELPPTIDGNLDDPCWQIAPKAVDFTDRNTGGELAKNQTEVRMVYTDKAIYTGWYLYDDKPEEIVAHQTEHQVRPKREDWVLFTIDPFHTHQFRDRTFFMANPLGSKYVSRPPKDVQKSDAPNLWKVAANIVDDGWVVEMEIPWEMLDYPQTTTPIQIGINFDRWHPRNRENSWWSKAGLRENGRPDGHWQDVLPPQK